MFNEATRHIKTKVVKVKTGTLVDAKVPITCNPRLTAAPSMQSRSRTTWPGSSFQGNTLDYAGTTRGRCGLLRTPRDGLALSTFRRSPCAPVHHIVSGDAGSV